MSDWWLNVLSSKGQTAAGVIAIVAGVLSFLATYANQQLSARYQAKLIRAGEIIERLDMQVSTVIGDEWPPLTIDQIEELKSKIIGLGHADRRIQIMYETKFGKQFASSIRTAFEAAHWNVSFTTGGGFEDGIEVGPGKVGVEIREAIFDVTKNKNIRALRPDEPDHGFSFVGVGAKIR